MSSIHDMQPGDYVKVISHKIEYKKISSIYGVDNGKLAPPSKGGFGVICEDGTNVSMWQANSYHKSQEIEKTNGC